MARLFITGTDTEVGKTHVTAALAASARRVGRVIAAKPIASGFPWGHPSHDATQIGAAAGHAPCGYASFDAPIAPHRAAEREGRALDDGVFAWVRDLNAPNVLIEGAGGWRVPLHGEHDLVDLARAAHAPVLVVAADRLGVINHTRLTVEAIARDGLEVVGVVLNRGVAGADPSRETNLADLRERLAVPIVACPAAPLGDPDVGDALAAALGVIWSRG